MLKSESRSEAFASKVWISNSFSGPSTALVASEVSTMKAMFFCLNPIKTGMILVSLGLDLTDIVAMDHICARKKTWDVLLSKH